MVPARIDGAVGANRKRAGVAILQASNVLHGMFRACRAHGWKGNYFSDASNWGDPIDDRAKQW